MKKLIASIILAGSLALTGCGSSNDDIFNQIGNINVNPPVVQGYFVNSATGNDATGAFATGSPYATIQAAVAAAGLNNTIIVQPGNYAGTVNLLNGQRLLGSESTLLMGTATTRPVLTGNIDMADGNTIDFVRVQGVAADAINGNGQNGGIVTNCEIANTTGVGSAGVSGENTSGTWRVTNNAFTNTSFFGTDFRTTGAAVLVAVIENNTMTNCAGAIGFISAGTSQVRASVKGNTMTASAGAGDAFELTCGAGSNFCLDLQDNTNDTTYQLFHSPTATGTFSVEEFTTITAAQPGGAGNTGTLDDGTGVGGLAPTLIEDGRCGPF